MPWVIELRYHSDSETLSMLDNLLDHRLRVCFSLLECSILVHVLEGLQLQGEALIFDEVPVEHVELGDVHGVQDLQDRIY